MVRLVRFASPAQLLCCPADWSRYQVAVTQRHEAEQYSSSIFNQAVPSQPLVDFGSFINGESIRGQDLVVWVATGLVHIPGAEDAPSTPTSGAAEGKGRRTVIDDLLHGCV